MSDSYFNYGFMSRAAAIKNIDALVERLGGPSDTARVLGAEPHQVQNWKTLGHIPARHYLVHRKRLEPLDLRVKDSVWGFE